MKKSLKAIAPDTLNFLATVARMHNHEHLFWLLSTAQLVVRYWASLESKRTTTQTDQRS